MVNNSLTLPEAIKGLESSARGLSKSSNQYKALRLASMAIIFAHQPSNCKSFLRFAHEFDAELTNDETKRLKSMGIDV